MSFKKPIFWDLKKPTLLSNLLYPFSYLVRFNNFINEKKRKKKVIKLNQFVLVIFIWVVQEKHLQQLKFIIY